MAEALPLVPYPDLESRVAAIENDGFVYFRGAVKPGEIAELHATMDRLPGIRASNDVDRTPENGPFYHKHLKNLFNRDALFVQFLDKPEIIDVAEAIHGGDCHIVGMAAWVTGLGRPEQTLHVDWLPISLPADVLEDPRVKMPIFITTTHFYLNDMYEELGPTKFVPGSHLSGRSPDGEKTWKGAEEHSILCKAGDAIMFRSEVWHRGSANTSDETRYVIQVHYAQRIITQKFPPYLNKFKFDEGMLAKLTPRQRRVLGDHTSSNYD